MAQLSATRSKLLARRARIGLASQGRDLLTEKRTALIAEFQRISADVLAGLDDLQRLAGEAAAALAETAAAEGPALRSAASLQQRELAAEVRTRTVAGVEIAEISAEPARRGRAERGLGLLSASPRLDRVADRYEAVVQRLLEFAAAELSLRRLAGEIRRTTRQINGLEQTVIPRLEAERDAIALVLDDRELEDRVRLRRARSRASQSVAR